MTYQAKDTFSINFYFKNLKVKELKDIMETVNIDLIHKYIAKYSRLW